MDQVADPFDLPAIRPQAASNGHVNGCRADLRESRRKPQPLKAVNLDRLPPHDIQMEMGVLGCQMIEPNTCIPEVIKSLKENAVSAHYDLRHQTIQAELIEMFNARVPVEIIPLQQRLKDKQLLEQIGGIPYLLQIQDAVPSASNLSYYLEVLKDKFLLRQLIATCAQAVGRIYDYEGEVDKLLDEVESEILKVNESKAESRETSVKDLTLSAMNAIENFFNRKGEITGLQTGYPDLDKMTDGLHGGEMIVIAARPSMGKTSLAMNIAEHVAINLSIPVGVFSLEMSSTSLALRMLCSLARVNLRSIRDGFMCEADFPKLMLASGRLSRAPLFIDDAPAQSILQLRARARRMFQRHGIKLFVIDYLQLLNAGEKGTENRQQEISRISGGIKALAKELNVPVIVLSQLNRELERDKSRKPRLSDLRESGAIEQDADLVGMLYKPNQNEEDEQFESDGIAVNLLIAKQRNGPTGDVNLTFLKPFTRFESAAKFSDNYL